METKTKKELVKLLLIVGALSILLTYGGDSFAKERTIYSITAEKGNNGIKSRFQIWANSKDDATENLTLNGWNVLTIKEELTNPSYEKTLKKDEN